MRASPNTINLAKPAPASRIPAGVSILLSAAFAWTIAVLLAFGAWAIAYGAEQLIGAIR